MTKLNILVGTVLGSLIAVLALYLGYISFKGYQAIDEDFNQFEIQNKCINKLVSQGIERKYIKRTETGCIVDYSES